MTEEQKKEMIFSLNVSLNVAKQRGGIFHNADLIIALKMAIEEAEKSKVY